ncbi:hypothetical protein J2T17_001226 [Paenibacillus mucilaginosus]|uniref:hypothetical protein n=1 Tax=Paenibacillus mucilaginosus TaxID=61624 RepID=UPI003D1984D0
MNKKVHILLLAGVIAMGSWVGLATGSAVSATKQETAAKTSLEEAVKRAAAQGGEVHIRDYTPFEWDLLHVFPPYSTPDQINARLGYHWTDRHLSSDDGTSILVFTRQGRVVGHWSYTGGSLGQSLYEQPMSPEEAVVKPAVKPN